MTGAETEPVPPRLSNSEAAAFACADADALEQIKDENLAVTDLAGFCTVNNGLNSPLDEVLIDGDFKAHLLQKIYFDAYAAVRFVITHLLSAAKRIGYGHFVNFSFVQSLLDVVKFMRLYVRDNKFHSRNSFKDFAIQLFSGEYLEAAVSFVTVFTDIESSQLFLARDPNSESGLQNAPCNRRSYKDEHADSNNGGQLCF